jgi:hypothetical protein
VCACLGLNHAGRQSKEEKVCQQSRCLAVASDNFGQFRCHQIPRPCMRQQILSCNESECRSSATYCSHCASTSKISQRLNSPRKTLCLTIVVFVVAEASKSTFIHAADAPNPAHSRWFCMSRQSFADLIQQRGVEEREDCLMCLSMHITGCCSRGSRGTTPPIAAALKPSHLCRIDTWQSHTGQHSAHTSPQRPTALLDSRMLWRLP